MTTAQRQHVLKAVERAMQLDTTGDEHAAIAAAAQALCLPIEAVQECMAMKGAQA